MVALSSLFESFGTGSTLSVVHPPLPYAKSLPRLAGSQLFFRFLSRVFFSCIWFCALFMSVWSRSWFVPHPDTAEGVAQELVSAGLISGQDLVVGKAHSVNIALSPTQGCHYSLLVRKRFVQSVKHFLYLPFPVAANLRKVIDNPPSSKSMTFPLVSISCVFLFRGDFLVVWEACWVVRCIPFR